MQIIIQTFNAVVARQILAVLTDADENDAFDDVFTVTSIPEDGDHDDEAEDDADEEEFDDDE